MLDTLSLFQDIRAMTRRTFVFTTAVLLLVPSFAFAQSAAPAPTPAAAPVHGAGHAAMAACKGDMATLCGAVERGGGRKIQCLKDNQAKLSAGCQSAIQAVLDGQGGGKAAKAGGKGMEACHADLATVCAGVEKGQGRLVKCLKENAAKLSPTCQLALQAQQARRALTKDAKAACAADQASLCQEAEKGKGMNCLRENSAKASPGCQQALASLPGKH